MLIGRNLSNSTRDLARASERLASGLRINHASDDAAGLAVASQLSASSRVYAQGMRNLNDGISALSVAEGSLQNATHIVMRLKELATQASNGSYSLTQRRAMDNEANTLINEFNRQIATTAFNGLNLFDGSRMNISLQAGSGSNSTITVGLGDQVTRKIGTGSFGDGATSFSSNGTAIKKVLTADFNGDGILDVAAVETSVTGTGALRVSIGDGKGGYTNLSSVNTGAFPSGLTAGDFNGDGKADLATTSSQTGLMNVFLNNGSGGFLSSTGYAMGTSIAGISSGDLNGDGNVDLVVADAGNFQAGYRLGNGDGTFGALKSYDMRTNPLAAQTMSMVRFIDVNGDGRNDIVAGMDSGASGINVRLQNSDGSFGSVLSRTGGSTLDFQSGDFNHDGYVDMLAVTSGNVGLFLGNGDGSFKTRTVIASYTIANGGLAIGDLDSNGSLDFVAGDRIYLNNGTGSFWNSSTLVPADTGTGQAYALGDMDGDGVLDVVSGLDLGGFSIEYATTQRSALIGQVDLLTAASARTTLDSLDTILDRLTKETGNIGASQSRLGSALRTLASSRDNYEAAASRIMDADIASEAAELVKKRILQQVASSVLAQANQVPLLALRLLRGD